MKVIVGMSGGVDSSMAAYLLKKNGYEVSGLSLILFEARGRPEPKACCSMKAIKEASDTARHIGIPHTSVDLRDEFMELVIWPFIDSYSKGLTPNPCILCNRYIKFPYLLKEAEKKGADFIATGHYGVTGPNPVGDIIPLRKGIDSKKDQSYVLYCLRQEELNRLILPLGGFRKEAVRAMAREHGVPAFSRPESQEICFIGEKNYTHFIKNLIAERQGPVIDADGNVIGMHKGISHYTLGQRKRLGISRPEPLYVIGIDPARNAVYAGPKDKALRKEFFVHDLNWILRREGDFRADVKVRSMMKAQPATVCVMAHDRVRVIYDEPQWAPAAGQSAVFYDGDVVIGGGIITNSCTCL